MRESLRDAVVYKLITIKTREAVVSTKPKKAAWIRNDLVNAVTWQTVRRGVGSDGKLFSAVVRKRSKSKYDNGDNSLHGADIIVQRVEI